MIKKCLVIVFLLSMMVTGFLSAAILQTERDALIALYNTTDGDNWKSNYGWKTAPLHTDGFALPGTEGTWKGISVANLSGVDYVFTVNLKYNGLNGTIPAAIQGLTELRSLLLDKNQLNGGIPVELTALTKLNTLTLNNNNLSGNIPHQMGTMGSLITLYLYGNNFSGPIPVQLGSCGNLRYLNLSGNQLAGNIPVELGNLSKLRILQLGDNQLDGTIPVELGNILTLQELYLYGNQLTDSIPDELNTLTALKVFDLNGNALTGTIPTWLGNFSGLTRIELTGNQLTGSIPAELGNLSLLEKLYLGDNQLSGTIPTLLYNATALKYLNLSNNQLTGGLVTELGNLTALESLVLGGNQLSGALPATIGNLVNLNYLHLVNNQFSGSLPTELGSLTKLNYLLAGKNQFSGTIPVELGNLVDLLVLDLAENMLYGDVPLELTNLTGLTSLNLRDNYLTATDQAVAAWWDGFDVLWRNFQAEFVEASSAALQTPDTTTGDSFGRSVQIQGNTAVVGAARVNTTGTVFIYQKDNLGNWNLTQEIIGPAGHTYFGVRVKMDGDNLVIVGAIDNSPDPNSPAVYVYERSGSGVWELNDATNYAEGISSATNVDLNEDRMVITDTNEGYGAAYIFEKNTSGTWDRVQAIMQSPIILDYGLAVNIRSDMLFVSAYGGDRYPGYVYVYKRGTDGVWSIAQTLHDASTGARYGNDIDSDGNRLVVTAPFHTEGTNSLVGAAYVYELDAGGVWRKTQQILHPQYTTNLYHYYCDFAAISGDRIAFTSFRSPDHTLQGEVYIVEKNSNGDWVQVQTVTKETPLQSDYLGYGLDIDGDSIIIGTLGGPQKGSAYIIKRGTDGSWPDKVQ